jgi:acetoin utilization protein AcuB
MLVRSRMTPNVLTVTPATSLGDALRITREKNIRHLPVIENGRVIGLVTERDLRLAAPAVYATGINYDDFRKTFEQKKVAAVMTAGSLHTTTEETPIEDAARIMYELKIDCLTVMRGDELVGILTAIDVMRSFAELFGTGAGATRIEVRMNNRPGELSRVVRAIGVDMKLNITGMVSPGAEGGEATAIMHVQTTDVEQLVEYLRKLGYRVGSPALDLEPETAHVREPLRVRPWGGDGF